MNNESAKQTVILSDRCDLVIDNVQNIVSFDDSYISLDTICGLINIEGKELKVDSLQKENGKIHVTGDISGIFYSSASVKRGAFSRFFK